MAMYATQVMEGTFSREEIIAVLLRKKRIAEIKAESIRRNSRYEWESAFYASVISLIGIPEEEMSINPMRNRPIIDLPISIRLYNILKKNLGNGSDRVLFREIESLSLHQIRQWLNFGKTTERELIDLCEMAGVKLKQ
jgi:hypothetical protein